MCEQYIPVKPPIFVDKNQYIGIYHKNDILQFKCHKSDSTLFYTSKTNNMNIV